MPKIGIIFQEPRLLPWLSVADNIGFACRIAGERQGRKVLRALARVGLSDKAKAWPRELSGGQAQRVAIARALVRSRKCCCWTNVLGARRLHAARPAGPSARPLERYAPTLCWSPRRRRGGGAGGSRTCDAAAPGRLFEEIKINLARPRDRQSPHFDNFKRRVLTALDRSLDRNVPDADPKSTSGEAIGGDTAAISH